MPRPTGSSAERRRWDGRVSNRPLTASPIYTGLVRIERTLVADQKRRPVGDANAARGQAYGEGVQGGFPVSIDLEQFAYDSRGRLVDLDQCRIAWPLRMHSIAIGCVGPGQQPPSAQLGLASTSHAIGDQRAFVFSDGAANLRDKLFVRVVNCRAVDKYDADPTPLEFFKHDHLVHVVARKTVGSGNQHHIEGCPCCLITQGIEAWPLELGPSVALERGARSRRFPGRR